MTVEDVTPVTEQSNHPLLSICVPSYRRAHLLRSCLYSLVPQVKELDGLVEIIVSDNCSPDNTAEVVEWARQFGPIRYHRNAENIGGARNSILLTQKLARGEYCWLIGDDDLALPEAVRTLVENLQTHPEIDYASINYTIVTGEYDGGLMKVESYLEEKGKRICFDTEIKVVPRWEEIIKFSRYEGMFTYMGCHVLRTSLWRAQEIVAVDDASYSSMITTFPHAYVSSIHMIGRPCLYIGQPLLLLVEGAQAHTPWYPFLRMVRMMDLSDFFAKRGARPDTVRLYRNLIFEPGAYDYWRLLIDKAIPGHDQFRPLRYFKYSGYRLFWRMLLLYPLNEFVKPRLRGVTRLLKRQAQA